MSEEMSKRRWAIIFSYLVACSLIASYVVSYWDLSGAPRALAAPYAGGMLAVVIALFIYELFRMAVVGLKIKVKP